MSTSDAAASKTLYISVGFGVTLLTGGLSYFFYKYFKKEAIPTKWRRVGTLEQINMYPIKSCSPLVMPPEAELFSEVLGLRYKGIRDRSLMLVNDRYEMVTARVYPKLVLVRSEIRDLSKLVITAEGMDPLELDFATLVDKAPGVEVHTTIWGSKLKANMCGEQYDKWFSQYLKQQNSGFHLLYYPYSKPVRSINSRLTKYPYMTGTDTGTFGDATSYMLINLASVEHLNTRLTDDVFSPLQFRGNFHLKMDEHKPYAEDDWEWVRIGNDAVFRTVAPCTRCIFTNINHKTGVRNESGNPLKLLKSYRLNHDYTSPTFGAHLGLRQPGTIKTNDIVYVNDYE